MYIMMDEVVIIKCVEFILKLGVRLTDRPSLLIHFFCGNYI